uniref:Translocase of inner mitochondrial membrane 10B n=1 Tax=Ornithorhynchus anatinus TaxID=9258 RepID=A0A6I8PC38_ORNAN
MRPVVLSGPGREQQGKQLGLEACLDSCAGKFVRSNHRLMAAYMQLMPTLVQRRVADLEAGAAAAGVEPAEPGVSSGPEVPRSMEFAP